MGGIIAALFGAALVVAGFIFRSKIGAHLIELGDKIATLRAERKGLSRYDSVAIDNKIHRLESDRKTTTWLRRACWVAVVIGVITVAATIITIVPTRNVAVTDAFGKPTGTLSNGLSVIAPWESVTVYDATIQTLEMVGDDKDGKPRQNVRIMGGTATAGMDVIVEWRIDPNADIQTLHKEWRNFDSLETRVVKPRLGASLNAVFDKYDPLVAQREKGATPVSMSVFEENLRAELQNALPKEILVRKTMIAFVQYPPNVQKALDDMQVELANTQVALQQKLTAEAQKAAIETLASAKMTPEAFQQQCLIVTERIAQQGKGPISAAWSCVGGAPLGLAITSQK